MIWFFILEARDQTYWKKMDYCNTSQEAFRVEHMLKRSCLGQGKTEERKSQQRTKAHAVETHFFREDNPTRVICPLLTTNDKDEE